MLDSKEKGLERETEMEQKQMFKNDIFEKWLDNKSEEIVCRLDKEKPSMEDMIILSLKALSNHFTHLDEDLRKDMKQMREDMDKRFEQVREDMDKRFNHMYTFMRWQTGIGVAGMLGIYLKLFMG